MAVAIVPPEQFFGAGNVFSQLGPDLSLFQDLGHCLFAGQIGIRVKNELTQQILMSSLVSLQRPIQFCEVLRYVLHDQLL